MAADEAAAAADNDFIRTHSKVRNLAKGGGKAMEISLVVADKPARQAWRGNRLWRDTVLAVTGVPRLKFFFQLRFGAIWCDWVLLAGRSSTFKVQGSKFKVQSGTGRGKSCRFGLPSGPIKPCWERVFTFIGFDWV
jgi:hypothetical protein